LKGWRRESWRLPQPVTPKVSEAGLSGSESSQGRVPQQNGVSGVDGPEAFLQLFYKLPLDSREKL
jgi:hypothetical protein